MKQDKQGNYIELADFLKLKGVVGTGGQAKLLIRAEKVRVNEEIETRVRRKLRDGFRVECSGKSFAVNISELK